MIYLYKPEEFERIQTCSCFLPSILSTLVNSCSTFCPLPQKRGRSHFVISDKFPLPWKVNKTVFSDLYWPNVSEGGFKPFLSVQELSNTWKMWKPVYDTFAMASCLEKQGKSSSGLKTDHAHIVNDKEGHLTMTMSHYTWCWHPIHIHFSIIWL